MPIPRKYKLEPSSTEGGRQTLVRRSDQAYIGEVDGATGADRDREAATLIRLHEAAEATD